MTGASLAFWAMRGSDGAALGLVYGFVHFAVLRHTAALYGSGRRLAPSALTLGRFAGAFVFFGLVARLGAVPLLSAFFSFLLARSLALRAARRLA
jgi:hypothetical protein